MAAVLNNAFLAAVAQVLHRIPSIDDLLRSLNREDALRDGSRYL